MRIMVQFSSSDDPLNTPNDRVRLGRAGSSGGGIGSGGFSVQTANQMLPLLERIVSDLIALTKDLAVQQPQIHSIQKLRKPANFSVFTDELVAIKEAFNTDRQRLESCQRELESLGVHVDSLDEAVIDFPAFMNRRPVMLCWKVGEPEVVHWHEIQEDFRHRKPIAGHVFDPVTPSVARQP